MTSGGESLASTRRRAQAIIDRLKETFPDATTALDYTNALELLVATILSAQCTDVRVNMVTPALFRTYRSASDYAKASSAELQAMIRSTGFYRNKTKNLIALGKRLERDHGGEVPGEMDELVTLPGVGRKTANVVLGNWFKVPAIAVDTHVKRLSGRLALCDETDPVKIEKRLMKLLPKSDWTIASHALILHGRATCKARRPRCSQCCLESFCPWPQLTHH